MAKRYTVIDAPRRVRLQWAKKAAITRKANKKLRECKAKLTSCRSDTAEAAPILHRSSVRPREDMRRYDYMSPELSPEPRPAEVAAAAADYVGYGYGANPRRRRLARNPELMVVHNPGRTYRSRAGRVSLSIRHRRNNMRRRKSRNLPLTIKVGGKRRTYRGFIKHSTKGGKMTLKQAAKRWKRSPKFHGYSKKRVAANRKRRSRRYNSWKGHRKAHSRAAKKGWRKRSRKSRSRRSGSKRRKGGKRSRCKANRWMKLVKKYGVKKAKRHYHCKRRNKRRKK